MLKPEEPSFRAARFLKWTCSQTSCAKPLKASPVEAAGCYTASWWEPENETGCRTQMRTHCETTRVDCKPYNSSWTRRGGGVHSRRLRILDPAAGGPRVRTNAPEGGVADCIITDEL